MVAGWFLMRPGGDGSGEPLQTTPPRPQAGPTTPAKPVTSNAASSSVGGSPAPFGGAPENVRPDSTSTGSRKADLEIVQNSHEITEDGHLRIIGRVMNYGEARAAGGKIRVILKNNAGKLLESTTVPLSPPLVGPGQLSSFEAFFVDPQAGFRLELELSWIW